jgi:uncharacterized protein YxjI
MRERLLGIGDDYWIESDDGQRAFKVNGKARVESDGDKVAEVPTRWLRARDTYGVEVHRAAIRCSSSPSRSRSTP